MGGIQDNLIREYAEKAADEITRKSIRAMQRITDTLSAEDSGLANAWDELCVQVQDEDSCSRDAYDETLYQIVIRSWSSLVQCVDDNQASPATPFDELSQFSRMVRIGDF